MRKFLVGVAAVCGVFGCLQLAAEESVDLRVVNSIRDEAFGSKSKVMDTAFYLTDVYGPRLTGSPNIKAAGQWAIKRMTDWGLANAKMEPWGPFGRGWYCTRFSASMTEPGFSPLIGFARPWSPGTGGPVRGQAIMAVISSPQDFEKFKGKLRGKIVLIANPTPSEMLTAPLAHRLTDAELQSEATAPDPTSGNPAGLPVGFLFDRPAPQRERGGQGPRVNNREFRKQLNKFLKDEGVLVVLSSGLGTTMTDGGDVFATAAGSQDPTQELPPPSVALASEHYNRIARLLDHNIPVTLEFDIDAKFTEPADSFNITAEIPGTDPNAGVVMLGGHFDSWTGGTGATDNAAGAAVAMEAVRILNSLGLKMRRTVRIALWSGEEEGLLGSRAYVKQHFGDPADMQPKPEQAKVSAYYNLDNGSGRIRGIYLQDNNMVRPIFTAWLEPFKDLDASTVTIRRTGSTDHVAFDAVGIPAFQFIQDPLEYSTRSHHSNMDLYDRLQAGDLEQASAVMAWMVYNTAVCPDMLPRKPLPKPSTRHEGETNETEKAAAKPTSAK
ncbi:MAG: M20/M25/M40 family metallo-hydrolase [Acidobacteriaceae bacterium]|nr:M20/M25/M40 family metallo-hydrolase [Acidobacteriaceae bacterium]